MNFLLTLSLYHFTLTPILFTKKKHILCHFIHIFVMAIFPTPRFQNIIKYFLKLRVATFLLFLVVNAPDVVYKTKYEVDRTLWVIYQQSDGVSREVSAINNANQSSMWYVLFFFFYQQHSVCECDRNAYYTYNQFTVFCAWLHGCIKGLTLGCFRMFRSLKVVRILINWSTTIF